VDEDDASFNATGVASLLAAVMRRPKQVSDRLIRMWRNARHEDSTQAAADCGHAFELETARRQMLVAPSSRRRGSKGAVVQAPLHRRVPAAAASSASDSSSPSNSEVGDSVEWQSASSAIAAGTDDQVRCRAAARSSGALLVERP
jgi:hypothetical protein